MILNIRYLYGDTLFTLTKSHTTHIRSYTHAHTKSHIRSHTHVATYTTHK